MNRGVIDAKSSLSTRSLGTGNGRARPDRVRFVSFFLPQFHPIPDNDLWWGKGFTEWTNTTKAFPLFPGHYQPHLPADLGYYDLRLREVRHEQVALAKQHGIDGFCYHYYWFSGTRLLNRPLDEMLEDTECDMPFCLCWANENWTRRWDAAEHEVLIEQKYLPEDDLNFIKSVVPFFNDARYIRLDGAPFLIVYRPQALPDARKTVNVWREYCTTIGLGRIHLCAALTHGNDDYEKCGFDSGVQFPPHYIADMKPVNHLINFYEPFHGLVMDYATLAESYLNHKYLHGNVFRTVFPSWDNTARTGSRATVILNGTPANYEYWLAESVRRTLDDFPGEDRFVFINAWNEWAEGCHLEPDTRFQRQFLEATLRVRTQGSDKHGFQDTGLPALNEDFRRSVVGDLNNLLDYHVGRLLGAARRTIYKWPKLRAVLIWMMRTFEIPLAWPRKAATYSDLHHRSMTVNSSRPLIPGSQRASNADAFHKYEHGVDLYPDEAAAWVVRMVGEGRRVLDIGAGPGSISRALGDIGKCQVVALENDPECIQRLIPICDHVYKADLNDPAWPLILGDEGKFDVVVAADVLEHLWDPWSTLIKMKGLIGDDGYVVVSLPHVGHSSVIACLLDNDFEYRDTGLLDSTHIRFFGMKNIQDLFEGAGMKIVNAHFVCLRPQATTYAARWRRLTAEIRQAASTNRFGSVYQVVVKAVPSESEEPGISLLSIPVEPCHPGIGEAVKSFISPRLTHQTRVKPR